MLIEDNLKEVLMKSDIATIKQLVLVNKNMKICCDDSTFWKNKFVQDGLPIINDKLNTFSLLDSKSNLESDLWSLKEWVHEYELIYKCKNDSINMLLVNKIESKQTYNTCNGFYITYGKRTDDSDNSDSDNSDDITNNSIPYYMIEKMDTHQIQIQFVDNKYIIWYYTNVSGWYCEEKVYNEVLNILIRMMYYSFKDKNIKIVDNIWHKKYTFNKIIYYDNSIEDDQLILIQRTKLIWFIYTTLIYIVE